MGVIKNCAVTVLIVWMNVAGTKKCDILFGTNVWMQNAPVQNLEAIVCMETDI